VQKRAQTQHKKNFFGKTENEGGWGDWFKVGLNENGKKGGHVTFTRVKNAGSLVKPEWGGGGGNDKKKTRERTNQSVERVKKERGGTGWSLTDGKKEGVGKKQTGGGNEGKKNLLQKTGGRGPVLNFGG